MAVSGRKQEHFSKTSNTLDTGDHICDPCLTISEEIKAYGFCTDCQECLCRTCFEYHQRTKASKDHKLLQGNFPPKQLISSSSSNECTEKCKIHKKEVIKFFCNQHKKLGCTDCMTLWHRTCDLDYIPDKCMGIKNSNELREVEREVDEKVKEVETIIQKANIKARQANSFHENVLTDITKFRKEIDEHLDEIQRSIESYADKKKANNQQKLQTVLDTCNGIVSNLKEIKSTIQGNIATKQDGQLFITMKQAKSDLSSNEVKDVKETLEDINICYEFERCKGLQDLLSNLDVFGKLEDCLSTPVPTETFELLTLEEDISATNYMFITGCAVLSCNKIILADFNNKNLRVFEPEGKVITKVKSLDSNPWDIAVLPDDQITVTMPVLEQILLLTTIDKLSVIQTIPVQGRCMGITFSKNHMYVVCKSPASICSMDIQGNLQRTIQLDSEMFNEPRYIVCDENLNRIYVSEHMSQSVICLSEEGKVLSKFCHDDLIDPEGLILLDDSSLMVCSYDNDKVLHTDFKQCQTIASVDNPQAICRNIDKNIVYIGSYNRNKLTMFRVKYKLYE